MSDRHTKRFGDYDSFSKTLDVQVGDSVTYVDSCVTVTRTIDDVSFVENTTFIVTKVEKVVAR